jgi:hypothetical protein
MTWPLLGRFNKNKYFAWKKTTGKQQGQVFILEENNRVRS